MPERLTGGTPDNWLRRQARQIEDEARNWPEWKKLAAKADDARRQTERFRTPFWPMRRN